MVFEEDIEDGGAGGGPLPADPTPISTTPSKIGKCLPTASSVAQLVEWVFKKACPAEATPCATILPIPALTVDTTNQKTSKRILCVGYSKIVGGAHDVADFVVRILGSFCTGDATFPVIYEQGAVPDPVTPGLFIANWEVPITTEIVQVTIMPLVVNTLTAAFRGGAYLVPHR